MREVLLLVGLTGCSGAFPPWSRGRVDADGDGWAAGAGDCDDTDKSISPSEVDVPQDGIDQDCDGQDDLALGIAQVEPGVLVITEVMVDPVGVDDRLGEWFELENRGEFALDLEGLQVFDWEQDDFVVTEPVVVEAGEQVVLGAWALPEDNGGAPVDADYPSGFGLSNDEDAIRLVADGEILDEVTWDPRFPLVDGRSLSLDPEADSLTNDEPQSWCPAGEDRVYGIGGRGTPGEPNDPCPDLEDTIGLGEVEPGDLVITEIMTDPQLVDGDFGEWFEVQNLHNDDIQLQGLTVSDDSGDAFEIAGSLVVPAGGVVVLGSFVDPEVNGGTPIDYEWRWDFGLANSGDTVRLSYGTVELDVVAYDNGHSFPDLSGASLSLDAGSLDAEANDDGSNWCAATTPYNEGDLGTPGVPNPVCGVIIELSPGDLVITEWMAEPLAVDGEVGEWIEVYNPTAAALDLYGLVLRDRGSEFHTISDHVVVPSQGLVVLGQSDEEEDNGGVAVDYEYGAAIRLGNDDDEIVLESAGVTVDEVSYDAGVLFPDLPGASVQLGSDSLDALSNDEGSAWCLGSSPYGAGDLGTPGSPNAACP
jgi:hypothetical protein